jgi:hypothetical protein
MDDDDADYMQGSDDEVRLFDSQSLCRTLRVLGLWLRLL